MAKTNLEKLQEAYENLPHGGKMKLVEDFGYTKQTVKDMVKNGRKNQNAITKLIAEIKIVSEELTEAVKSQNELVQAV